MARIACCGLAAVSVTGCSRAIERSAANAQLPPVPAAAATGLAVSALPAAKTPAAPAPPAERVLTHLQEVPTWAQSKVIHDVPVGKEKCIALTFDDGPWPNSTRQILKLLKEHDAKATFFMVGEQLREYPYLGREIVADGHAVGNHSWSHASRPHDPAGEVRRTDALIEKELGASATLFRPPYGILTNGYARTAKSEKQAVFIWSIDTLDWRKPGAERIASRVIRGAGPGKIALMHDGGGDRHQTVAAVKTILETLGAEGYRFVTLPELMAMRREPAKTAKVEKATTKAGPKTLKQLSVEAPNPAK